MTPIQREALKGYAYYLGVEAGRKGMKYPGKDEEFLTILDRDRSSKIEYVRMWNKGREDYLNNI
jgi:hypothetical protein